MEKYFIEWKYISRVIIFVQFIIIVVGSFYAFIQFKDIKENQLNRENDLSIRYYDKLNSGTDLQIFLAIEHKKPLLYTNGGKFNTDQLDDYLGDLHDVGHATNKGLLNTDDICSNFSDIAEETWKNSEIQEYLSTIRKENPTYFTSFDDLYNFVENCD